MSRESSPGPVRKATGTVYKSCYGRLGMIENYAEIDPGHLSQCFKQARPETSLFYARSSINPVGRGAVGPKCCYFVANLLCG